MEAEREVHGNIKALSVGQHLATASQVVNPLATVLVVVGIVVDAIAGRVNLLGEA